MVEEKFESLPQPSSTIPSLFLSPIDCYKMDILILYNEIIYEVT